MSTKTPRLIQDLWKGLNKEERIKLVLSVFGRKLQNKELPPVSEMAAADNVWTHQPLICRIFEFMRKSDIDVDGLEQLVKPGPTASS